MCLYLVLSDARLLAVCVLRVTLYDYQALCWVYSESSDSGHTLLDVSIKPHCLYSSWD